jgi:hypothetical protein
MMGVGGLLLLGYILLNYELGLTSAAATETTPVPPTPTPASIDLWVAHTQAHAVAQAQAADVQLVSASAQWQAASEKDLLAGVGNWAFTFYSPASGNVLDVVVSTEKTWVVNQTRVWVAPEALADGKWLEGPRDALLIFLAHGGRAFLDEHPQAVVDLHLSASNGSANDGASSVWSILTLDVNDKSRFAVLIDAGTGQVLSSTP